jgi:hypothetical protein
MDDVVLAAQVEYGAVVGGIADDPTAKHKHQAATKQRLPWLNTILHARDSVRQWESFCGTATKFCGSWRMLWADGVSRSDATGSSPAAAYTSVRSSDLLWPAVETHLPALARRSFSVPGNAAALCVIPCLSMDPSGSLALDDAVSVVPLTSNSAAASTLLNASHRLFVHIADVIHVLSSAASLAGSLKTQKEVFQQLVLSAVQRASSFYTSQWGLKTHQGMVPPAVAKASTLAGGCIRPALTVVLDVDTVGCKCSLVSVGPSLVYNVAPLSYQQGQSLLAGELLGCSASQLPESRLLQPTDSGFSSLVVAPAALAGAVHHLALVKDALYKRRTAPLGTAAPELAGQDLTPASIARLVNPTLQQYGSGDNVEAQNLVSEVMQVANGVIGSLLAARASDGGIFLAQPPPPVQSMYAIGAFCMHSKIDVNAAEFGFYKWPVPKAAAADVSTAPPQAESNDDKNLVATVQRIFRMLQQQGQYISGSAVFDRPSVLPDLLSDGADTATAAHASAAQIVVDAVDEGVGVSMAQLQSTALAFHHCGMGFTAYTHFTSPLRRAADLLVHAQLHSVLGTGNAALLTAASSNGEHLQAIVQHLNNTRHRQRTLQRMTEDVVLRMHLQKFQAWAPAHLLPSGRLAIPAFRHATLPLPRQLTRHQQSTSHRLQDVIMRPNLTNASLFHGATSSTDLSQRLQLETDGTACAAWGLFHVPLRPHASIESSAFALSALAFPMSSRTQAFPQVVLGSFEVAALTGPLIEEAPPVVAQDFLHVHVSHLLEQSDLSMVPFTAGGNQPTTVCTSVTHYLADFLPALWGELIDSSMSDQPPGKANTAANVMVMFDAMVDQDAWGSYRASRRAYTSSSHAHGGTLKPVAALWLLDAEELLSNSHTLPRRLPTSADLPVGTPSIAMVSAKPSIHLVQHPAGSRAIGITSGENNTLLPEHSPRVTRVSTLLAPPSAVDMAGRTATLLLPAAAVNQGDNPWTLVISPGDVVVISAPSISWKACAFVRSVSKRSRLIPEAPKGQASLDVFSHTASGLHCAAMLHNTVVPISVVFMNSSQGL